MIFQSWEDEWKAKQYRMILEPFFLSRALRMGLDQGEAGVEVMVSRRRTPQHMGTHLGMTMHLAMEHIASRR
jgi:hypothetical protein